MDDRARNQPRGSTVTARRNTDGVQFRLRPGLSVDQRGSESNAPDSERFVELFRRYIGLKLTITMLALVLVGCFLIWISLVSVEGEYWRHILSTVGDALFVTALISVPVKWFLTRQFDRLAEEKYELLLKKLTMAVLDNSAALDKRVYRHHSSVEKALRQHHGVVTKGIRDVSSSSTSLTALSDAKISRVYSRRGEAAEDIHAALEADGVDSIQIIGISLNDFLRDEDRRFHDIWKMLADFIRGRRRGIGSKPLRIHLLLIDPDCRGAYHRAQSEERDEEPSRLRTDLLASMNKLHRIDVEGRDVAFEARIYRLAPIIFLVRTNFVSFVQHYYFRPSHDPDINIPVFKYRTADVPSARCVHSELGDHFSYIWKNASISIREYLEESARGVDTGLREAGIRNVYFLDGEPRHNRIRYLIENTRTTLWIKGVSLKSFFELESDLYQAVQKVCGGPEADVKILLLDPKSKQAFMRSFREYLLIHPNATHEEFTEAIRQQQPLYKDTNSTIDNIKHDLTRLLSEEQRKRVSVAQYECAPEAFILITDTVAVVEQYHYGKVKEQGGGRILGGEVPLVEYEKTTDGLYEVFKDSFKYAYDNWSEPIPIPDTATGPRGIGEGNQGTDARLA